MKYVSLIFYTLLFALNYVYLENYDRQIKRVEENQVFSMDYIRRDYHDNLKLMYFRGCVAGVKDFDQNRPVFDWCYEQREEQDGFVGSQIANLGRLSRCQQ